MASITAIDARSVHHIQSGQVIVDLNSVVKELLENSLDAGATSVEVRFKNNGLDAIEVQDNGTGIAPEDFDTLALKHHTSKLSHYHDLSTLGTFGFRGEALSSLCALSTFHVLTARAQDGGLGKKLEFDAAGKLKSSTLAAAQTGTTVFVQEIFHNLPVRRKELEKNIKREYSKVLGLLYTYACISVGVRFTVSNHMPKANKSVVFSTKSNATTKENVANLFGAKTMLALMQLDLHLDLAPSHGHSGTQSALAVHVQGHISKPVFGEGRQAPDRQMFFVNSRPCQLPQVSKAINEVYRSFNVSQSPFILANLIMDTTAYDVNVSPDKRTIMLHDQTALLDSLKKTLTDMFERTDHTVPRSTLPNRGLSAYQPLNASHKASTEPMLPASDEIGSVTVRDHAHEPGVDASNLRGLATQPSGSPSKLIHDWVGRDTVPRSKAFQAKPVNGGLDKEKHILREVVKRTFTEMSAPLRAESCEEPETRMASEHDQTTLSESLPTKSRGDSLDSPQNVALQDEVHCPPPDRSEVTPVKTSDSVDNAGPLCTPPSDVLYQRSLLSSRSEAPRLAPRASTCAPALGAIEPTIPVVAPKSQKVAPGPIQSAFDRMRPRRTPLQTAEITVGDVTTMTVIGDGPPYKKRRIHRPDDSQAVARYGASPSLAHGLRRNFAAPGSQLALESNALPFATLDTDRQDDRSSSEERSDESSEFSEAEQAHGVWAHDSCQLDPARNMPFSNPLEEVPPAPADIDDVDEGYMVEAETKAREEQRIALLIHEAEKALATPTEAVLKRAAAFSKNGGNHRDSVLRLAKIIDITPDKLRRQISLLNTCLEYGVEECRESHSIMNAKLNDAEAESHLSLTVKQTDFKRMRIIGQFNLGFILAVRPAPSLEAEDDLFIIDQHAADEKYNYEQLQRTVVVQGQRLVRPRNLDLTATQEEVVLNHSYALKANGFEIESTPSLTSHNLDEEHEENLGRRKQRLLTLPMSREKTFDMEDLEELLHLLLEQPAGSNHIPRPRKVQKLLAMRACRSSIMVGNTLTPKQMQKVVGHMGEMEKPWNCPHGRPTMRHLAGLGNWKGWRENDLIDNNERDAGTAQGGRKTNWEDWLRKK